MAAEKKPTTVRFRRIGRELKRIRTDAGLDLTRTEFETFLDVLKCR